MTVDYVGRFAPSLTGPLHFGSLIAGLASYLDARANQGRWRVRLDDVDVLRMVPGSDTEILASLEAHALAWDGSVVRQSDHLALYREALAQLIRTGSVFACSCSRRTLRGQAVYPGTCRSHIVTDVESDQGNDRALRIRVPMQRVSFDDLVLGRYAEQLDQRTGDFVIRRRDGLFAYQLAIVVDDAEQGVTRVLRGADLLDNTPRQLFLMKQLGLPAKQHAHIPVITDRLGAKLSKQTFAAALRPREASMNLYVALTLLGQQPPTALSRETPERIVAWAARHWDLARIPALRRFLDFVSI